MKLIAGVFFAAVVIIAAGCSGRSSILQPRAAEQLSGTGINWEPDPAILSITSTSGNAVILDESAGVTGSAEDDPQFAWFPSRKNGKLNLVWWSVWDTAPEEVDHQVRVGWSDENLVMHYAWVTPEHWDGEEPAICQKNPYTDIPRIFAYRSMAEYLAGHASSDPMGKILLRKRFGENVQNWTEVWQKVAEELAVRLPAAVKWTNHDTDLETFKRLWGEDFWVPNGNWDKMYPILQSDNFGLD